MRTKVLFLMDKLTTGGAEIYFTTIENNVNKNQIDMYTAAGPGELYDRLKNKDKFKFLSRKNHLINIYHIVRILLTNNIKVVHANCLRIALYMVVIKLFFWNVKVMYTKHNVTMLEKKPKLFSFILNTFVDKIITVSNFEKDNLLNLGVKEEKIRTIYNGVELEKFEYHMPVDHTRIINIGILARLSEEKNHSLFLDTALLLKQNSNRPIKYYIAGDGPERKNIETFIKENGLRDDVVLLGNVSDPDRFLQEMDILLLTSKREVFPMTIIEAMAKGTPVVSINVGGIREAIQDDVNGYLVNAPLPSEFSTKIEMLLMSYDKRLDFSRRSRSRVEQEFTLQFMLDAICEEYQEMDYRLSTRRI
ncbi:glycosyltransferase family 4 protein [Paenibacillus sp. NPDC057967]|uniref:glycosyltransferase family 4 protein n=1 Tax=Paenibacillus sp. NPDC057967 TaxID=3346293 RepID=UPI0036DE04EA